jgi:ketosteroid isomerase-like protein
MGRLLDLVEAYYDACNSGEAERVRACFAPDAVHWFTRLPPARGADAIAAQFAGSVERLHARWTVEHGIEQGEEACVEWTMRWRDPDTGAERLDRGTEWYLFDGDLIFEVRAYHHSSPKNRSGDLVGFDHAARGHAVLR